MKKLFFTLALVATFLTANAQNVYWSCYAMKVDDPEGFVKAFDAFMATESGKSLPGVGLSQIQFNNTINDATHQLCFFSPNPERPCATGCAVRHSSNMCFFSSNTCKI